ncbi:MAG: IMPACT family protein [Methylotetracoccus sp.]|jgi:uncharacterized YigZ family protein|nr:IMPACT family protein [Methylotetracoccus sp.]
MNGFMTLAAASEHRDEIKGSVFIACAARAETPALASHVLRALAARYPDASHLCWAYRIGSLYRFSDAGEPSGTAGQPIFRAIEGQGLDQVVVGVIRYFGGTKLGAGGLVRAYSGVAAEALRKAEKRQEFPQQNVEIQVPFGQVGTLYHVLDALDITERREHYDEHGLILRARIAARDIGRLESLLRDATRDEYILSTPDRETP